jgi:hypothetical protein
VAQRNGRTHGGTVFTTNDDVEVPLEAGYGSAGEYTAPHEFAQEVGLVKGEFQPAELADAINRLARKVDPPGPRVVVVR